MTYDFLFLSTLCIMEHNAWQSRLTFEADEVFGLPTITFIRGMMGAQAIDKWNELWNELMGRNGVLHE